MQRCDAVGTPPGPPARHTLPHPPPTSPLSALLQHESKLQKAAQERLAAKQGAGGRLPAAAEPLAPQKKPLLFDLVFNSDAQFCAKVCMCCARLRGCWWCKSRPRAKNLNRSAG